MQYRYYKERIDTIWAPGIKMLSKGLPLKVDTYQSCTNFCKYCYAEELRGVQLAKNGVKQNPTVARLLDIKNLAKRFEKASRHDDEITPFMNWAIRNKYYIELGTTGETFQEADLDLKVTYNFLKLASSFNMPLFINTKLNLICKNDEYKKLLINYTAPIIICLTVTTIDDKLGKLYEPFAPLPSERLKTIKELNSYDHINSFVYISPFIPSVSDRNTEEFVGKVLDSKIVGAYIRDFYMQGKTFQNPFWQKYIKENSNSIEVFPGGYHATYDSKKDFYFKFQELATKRDKDFKVLGMKTKWFELNPYHGRINFDRLDEKFKRGVVDFTAIPLLRKIREKMDVPQMLLWGSIGHKEGMINLPKKIRTNEGRINTLMESGCNCNTSDIDFEVGGYDWLRDGMWNGWGTEHPSGFFSKLDYIFPVKKDGKFYKDKENNFVYTYLPKKHWNIVTQKGGQTSLLIPDTMSSMKNPYVDLGDLEGLGYEIPTRIGGTEDKFYNL